MPRHFTKATFLPVKPLTNAPGTFEKCDSPWSDLAMCALIYVEDILSTGR